MINNLDGWVGGPKNLPFKRYSWLSLRMKIKFAKRRNITAGKPNTWVGCCRALPQIIVEHIIPWIKGGPGIYSGYLSIKLLLIYYLRVQIMIGQYI